ncbi:MAG: FAD-dependent oxidoreductase [Xanthomonadales bacterium]|nr:FAD-dependent oxidoreductase [Xanthomonadales bacterium]
MSRCDIVVIGGGLTGCAAAFYLARAGAQVVLLECNQLNQGASGQNAGSLHFQLEHRLIRNLDKRVRELELYLGLARHAIKAWRNIETELGTTVELGMDGGLMIAETTDQVALLRRKLEIERNQGLEVELLDGDAARDRAPYLSDHVRAALYCPDEGHCNPRLLTPAYAHAAEVHGATIRTGAAVTALRRRRPFWEVTVEEESGEIAQLRCDAVLDAAGIAAARIVAMTGVDLPLFAVRLTMNATEKTSMSLPHLVQHVGRKLSLKQTEDGNLLIGGGWPARPRPSDGAQGGNVAAELLMASVRGNLAVAADIVPAVRSLRLIRSWTGSTANTPDDLPVLGEVTGAPGLFVAAGGSGFTYGPSYAKLISELMLDGVASYPLDPFSPDRFDGPRTFAGSGS